MLPALRLLRGVAAARASPLTRAPVAVQLREKKKKAGVSAAKPKHMELRSDIQQLVDIKSYNVSMQQALDSLSTSFSKLTVGTVSPSYLDDVAVEAYGSRTALKTVAQVSVRDGRTLFITSFDDATTPAIEKAIRTAGLNLTPIAEGNGRLRVPIPKPSKESRQAMRDAAQRHAEHAKVATRQVRRRALDVVKGVRDDISKDDVKRLEASIQHLTDDYIGRIDQMVKLKVESLIDGKLSMRK